MLLLAYGRGRTVAPPGVTPDIEGVANASGYTVNQTGTVDVTVTLTRIGEYAGDVVLSAAGLPTGVTASYPTTDTFSGGTTSLVVRLTSSAASTVTNDAFTITLTPASGPDPVVLNLTLTVQATPTWAPNRASVSTGMTELFDEEMSQLDATTEFPSPAGNRVYGISGYKQAGGAAYGTHVYRHAIPGDSLGGGVGNGKMENETFDWKRFYICIDVTLEGSGGSPYKIHSNEEKFLFPVAYIDGGGVANTGTDLAWIQNSGIQGGEWVAHLQNGLGAARRYQNISVYPNNNGSTNIIEHYIQVNSPGNSDGIWQMWVNGTLAADFSDVEYYDDLVAVSFKGFRLITVRGGGDDDAPTPTGGQARVHSRIEIWTATSLS